MATYLIEVKMKIFNLDNDSKYSILSRFFHWFRFIILLAIYLGAYKQVFDHRILGIIMFVFISLNIAWRFFNKSPKSFAGSIIEENIEKAVHTSLYVLIFSLPILGYLASMNNIHVFGVNIHSIYHYDWFTSYLEDTLKIDVFSFRGFIGVIHKFLTTILLCLAGLHIFVIIFNRIFRKTGELKRMM